MPHPGETLAGEKATSARPRRRALRASQMKAGC